MFWALFLLLFHPQLRAQEISEVTKILESKITPEVECTPESLQDTVLQACATDVCGAPGTTPTAFLTGEELDGFVLDGEGKKEFDRSMELLTKAGNDWMAGMLFSLNNLESYLNSSSEELDPALYNAFYLLNRDVSFQVKGDEIKVLPRLTPEMSEKFRVGIKAWAAAKEVEAKTDPLLRMRLGISTPKNSIAAVKLRWDKLKEEIAALPEDDAIRVEYEKSIPEVQSLIDRDDVSEVHVYGVNNYVEGFKAKLHPLDPTKVKGSSQNVFDPSCKQECLEALRPLISKAALKKVITSVRSRLDAEFKDFQLGCATALGIQAKHGQLPGQREKALALVDSALEKVTAQGWWSEHTKASFRSHIKEKVKVAHQFNTEKIITLENLQQNQKQTAYKLSPQVFLDTIYKADGSSVNMFAQAIPFCPSPRVSTNDSFGGLEEPLLHVSPFSCEHPDLGEGIVAHELGHALSAFMSTNGAKSPESAKKYKEVRTCVNKQSPEQNLVLPDQVWLAFPGDTLTGEEDMADWLSSNASTSAGPVACTFLPHRDGKFLVKGLQLRPAMSDSHSASFLRAIRETKVRKKKLTAACETVMNAYRGVVEAGLCQ